MNIVERDYMILRELDRWRFCLGRHIKMLTDFEGVRACDRRLKKLVEAGYIERKKILYGIPSLYTLTHKGKVLLQVPLRKDKIPPEQILHSIAVIDTAIYFSKVRKLKSIITEKELHKNDGFGVRKHQPDFVISVGKKTLCVEVELTLKSIKRIEQNIESNFMNYDYQIWVIPNRELKINKVINTAKEKYTGIYIIHYEAIKKYINSS